MTCPFSRLSDGWYEVRRDNNPAWILIEAGRAKRWQIWHPDDSPSKYLTDSGSSNLGWKAEDFPSWMWDVANPAPVQDNNYWSELELV